MSGIVSSSWNVSTSVLHPNLSSYNDELPLTFYCFIYAQSSYIFTSFIITKIIILLPLSSFILYIGLKQWMQELSTSSAAMSPSDYFTYHQVIIELIGIFGCFLCGFGIRAETYNVLLVGLYVISFTWSGQLLFHVLTCVERYLAVVHPITYLSLRNERRIRNITMGCIWLLCIANMALEMMETIFLVLNVFIMVIFLLIIFFCNISILWVLVHPGPGEHCGAISRVDPTKRRAFHTVVVILVVLMVRFALGFVWSLLQGSQVDTCMLLTCDVWFDVPSSLVLPLLFLHRAGKLTCCKKHL